jgi:hypothetical protein
VDSASDVPSRRAPVLPRPRAKKHGAGFIPPRVPSVLTGPVHPFGSLAALTVPPSERKKPNLTEPPPNTKTARRLSAASGPWRAEFADNTSIVHARGAVKFLKVKSTKWDRFAVGLKGKVDPARIWANCSVRTINSRGTNSTPLVTQRAATGSVAARGVGAVGRSVRAERRGTGSGWRSRPCPSPPGSGGATPRPRSASAAARPHRRPTRTRPSDR